MREIKFRAWDGKRMVYTDWRSWRNWYNECTGGKVVYGRGGVIETSLSEPMQYTGLKDKNGKEIYEGDILKAIDVLLTVWYNDSTASFDVLHYGDETGDTESLYSEIEAEIPLEIIGNIYENPELLKE